MDYDMTIHHTPDAQAWAKFFIETTKDMDREVFRDEGHMIAWFANSMMAMHDYLHKTEIDRLRKALERIADSSNWGGDGGWDADSYPNEIAEEALYPDEALKEKE
jgi:xylose isomerase